MTIQEERRRRRRIEVIIRAWTIMLIFSQMCVSSSIAHSSNAIPRKVGFFHEVTTITSAVGTGEKRNRGNKLYDEDKRLVHTGPNPLHN
ncbi:hypothetical protein R3W88_010771 [Solanum pinnatisectum]|uniref:Uncharacterized protein n=1 Tax=Solanum pinnatisectum TaxID=50273 RepID=A0AAV9L5J8_9SOLN|nr:hypothetical protein R3W88_010771 [Solanum pinnatisectum]